MEIKRCPNVLCKSTNINYFWCDKGGHINCLDCGATLKAEGIKTFEEAVKKWNTRYQDSLGVDAERRSKFAVPSQASVKLPEKYHVMKNLMGKDVLAEREASREGWNTCLEEFKRLNPNLTEYLLT